MKSAKNLIDKMVENVLSLTITFVIGTGFFGGSGYLILQYPLELARMDENLSRLEQFVSEIQDYMDVLNDVRSSLFMPDTSGNSYTDMLDLIIDSLALSQLEPTLKESILDWCNETVRRLSEERSIVAGIITDGEFTSAFRSKTLAVCDAYIEIVRDIEKLAANWNGNDNPNKLERVSTLSHSLQLLSNQNTELQSFLDQVQKHLDRRMESESRALRASNSGLARKAYLAFIGLVIGLLIYSFLAYSLVTHRIRQK